MKILTKEFNRTPAISWHNFFIIAKDTRYSDLSLVKKYSKHYSHENTTLLASSVAWKDCMLLSYILSRTSNKGDTIKYIYRLPKLSETLKVITDSNEVMINMNYSYMLFNAYDNNPIFTKKYRDYTYMAKESDQDHFKKKLMVNYSYKLNLSNIHKDSIPSNAAFFFVIEELTEPIVLSCQKTKRNEQIYKLWGVEP